MGLAKREWEESLERGWDAPDKYVCSDCVEDEFLKDCIQDAAEAQICDYCGGRSGDSIAAPVETIMLPISDAFHAHFAEPAAAGVPRDSGEWIMDFTGTAEALGSLPLNCQYDLFDDVVQAFHDDAWVPCAGGHWQEEHDNTRWTWGWEHFEQIVKTRTRYFFSDSVVHPGDIYEQDMHPTTLLYKIAHMTKELGLFRDLSADTLLYRVRETHAEEIFDTFDTLGPPPNGSASAGRMNPAGISYFYLAKERETAIGEVLKRPPCRAAITTFSPKRDLVILDLVALPETPSVFDAERYDVREAIIFLKSFIKAISRPISRDGQEHIDYVPSQVVSEFFAQVFMSDEDHRIDGMIYPSALVVGGQNVVIFPPREIITEWNSFIDMNNVEQVVAADWGELTAMFSA